MLKYLIFLELAGNDEGGSNVAVAFFALYVALRQTGRNDGGDAAEVKRLVDLDRQKSTVGSLQSFLRYDDGQTE